MVFKNDMPQANDRLILSQQEFLANNAQVDTSFGVDHYTFSDTSADNGKHKHVKTPDQAGHVATAVNEPAMYATNTNDTAAVLGVVQFSRGGNSALPTPLTSFHLTAQNAAAGGVVNIFDFSGLGAVMAWCFVQNTGGVGNGWAYAPIFWNGSVFINKNGSGAGLDGRNQSSNVTGLQVTGNILQINWGGVGARPNWDATIQFMRIE